MGEAGDERIEDFVRAFNSRDAETVIARCASDCEIVAQRSEIEGPFRGHTGVRRWVEGYVETVADVHIAVERVESLDDHRVLVLGRQSGTGSMGGATFESPLAAIVTYEGDLVKHLRAYPSHDAAIAAAGLPS